MRPPDDIARRLHDARRENPEWRAFISFREPRDPPTVGPLSGLTFAVKDVMRVRDLPTTLGLEKAVWPPGEYTAPLVTQLEKAGAVLFGTTNLDPLGITAHGRNRWHGDVRNPANLGSSPLGSSGGSAAATAAGWCDFALGTDFGGSVRAPAAACGVWGLKFTPGFVNDDGILLFHPLHDVPGIFGQSGSRLLQLLRILRPDEPESPRWTSRGVVVIPPKAELGSEAEWFERSVRVMARQAGLPLAREPFFLDQIHTLRKPLATYAVATTIKQLTIPTDALPPTALALLSAAEHLTSSELEAAHAQIHLLRARFDTLFHENAIFVTPSLPLSSSPPNWYMVPANLMQYPALTTPRAPGNRPGGLHLMGPPMSEFSLINFALNSPT